MKIEFHPLTITELNEFILFDNKKRTNLGDELRKEVYKTINRIVETPFACAAVKGYRRALVKRFPFAVILGVIGKDRIRILVIRHQRRNPNYGRERE